MNNERVAVSSDDFTDAIVNGTLSYLSSGLESIVFSFNDFFAIKCFIVKYSGDITYDIDVLNSISLCRKITSSPSMVMDVQSPINLSDVARDISNSMKDSSAMDMIKSESKLALVNTIIALENDYILDSIYVCRYMVLTLKYDQTLAEFSVAANGPSFSDIISIYYQLLLRLIELEVNRVIHRDIKDNNVMISRFNKDEFTEALRENSTLFCDTFDVHRLMTSIRSTFFNEAFFYDRLYIAVIDFGFAGIASDNISYGNAYHERYKHRSDTKSGYHTDIYASTIIILQLMMSKSTKHDIDIPRSKQQLLKMLNGYFDDNEGIFSELADIMDKSINREAKTRYTAIDCIESTVFDKIRDIYAPEYNRLNHYSAKYDRQHYYVNVESDLLIRICNALYSVEGSDASFILTLNCTLHIIEALHLYYATNNVSHNVPYYIKVLSIYYMCLRIYSLDVIRLGAFFKHYLSECTTNDDNGREMSDAFIIEFKSIPKNELREWYYFLFDQVLLFETNIHPLNKPNDETFADIIERLKLNADEPKYSMLY